MTISCIESPRNAGSGNAAKSRAKPFSTDPSFYALFRVAVSLRVAVCTNRPAGLAGECLAALGRQVPDGELALVASGLGADEVELHRRAFAGTILVEPRPGLSRARNRALAWAGGDDV